MKIPKISKAKRDAIIDAVHGDAQEIWNIVIDSDQSPDDRFHKIRIMLAKLAFEVELGFFDTGIGEKFAMEIVDRARGLADDFTDRVSGDWV